MAAAVGPGQSDHQRRRTVFVGVDRVEDDQTGAAAVDALSCLLEGLGPIGAGEEPFDEGLRRSTTSEYCAPWQDNRVPERQQFLIALDVTAVRGAQIGLDRSFELPRQRAFPARSALAFVTRAFLAVPVAAAPVAILPSSGPPGVEATAAPGAMSEPVRVSAAVAMAPHVARDRRSLREVRCAVVADM